MIIVIWFDLVCFSMSGFDALMVIGPFDYLIIPDVVTLNMSGYIQ